MRAPTPRRAIVATLRRLFNRRDRRGRRKREAWVGAGRPGAPPSALKHEVIAAYARRFALGVLVETGTFEGGTVSALKDEFRRVYTIELDEALWRQAQRRFRRFAHVIVLQGDSAAVLPSVLAELREPALFWLDAHYSGGHTARGVMDTPIVAEVRAILAHPVHGHVMLVDDAREFGADPAYPTLDALRDLITTQRADLAFSVADDIVRIHPRGD